MLILKKGIVFVLLFFLITQLAFSFLLPSSVLYNERPIYDVFKDDVYSIEATIAQVKRIIIREKLKNYIILLGDSVAYGGVCPPQNSLAFYMNELSIKEGKKVRVFNLSAPSMMLGDIFGMITLLNKYGISTDNLVVQTSYVQFVCRNPVFWLKHYVNEIDPVGYEKIIDAKLTKPITYKDDLVADMNHAVLSKILIYEYRSFVSNYLRTLTNKLLSQPVYPILPWTKKVQALKTLLNKEENKWYYTDKPIKTDESNLEIYYLNKIIDMQKGKNTLYFLAAMNDNLLGDNVLKPGYMKNMADINKYFNDKEVYFVDYNRKIDYDYFSDNIHLTADGYKHFAEKIWSDVNK